MFSNVSDEFNRSHARAWPSEFLVRRGGDFTQHKANTEGLYCRGPRGAEGKFEENVYKDKLGN